MHGELAQVIALAAHGSAWLTGATPGPAPQLENDNSTFQYVRRVRFDLHDSDPRTSEVASSARDWLTAARDREIERLWLVVPQPEVVSIGGQEVPDRMLVGFAGAGHWFLLGTSRNQSEAWRAAWAVGDADAPDGRIWDVEYQGRSFEDHVQPPQPDIGVSAQRLVAALENAERFARENDLDDWGSWFADARRLSHAGDFQPPYHPDMLPPGAFSRQARQLLATATRSWVFGGMGSWNDLAFGTASVENEYDEVSAELYSAVLTAFLAAVNAELET